MYKLTDRRLEAAKDVLERFHSWLYEGGGFDAGYFESELRKRWDLGYQTLKDIAIDMFKNHPRYRYVAAYYMQHSNAPGPVCEFQPSLAELYHHRSYSHLDEYVKKFWDNFTCNDAKELRKQIDSKRAEFDQNGKDDQSVMKLQQQIENLQLRLFELTGEKDY